MSEAELKVPFSKAVKTNQTPVDAVRFIMDNILDWDHQQKYGGMRMTTAMNTLLLKSLRMNLNSACPHVQDHEAFDLYGELSIRNWHGDFDTMKSTTETLIRGFIEAERGDPSYLQAIKGSMLRRIDFMERHYHDVAHDPGVPLHVTAEAMEKNDRIEPRQNAEALSGPLHTIRTIVDTGGQGRANSIAKRRFPGLCRLIGL